VNGFTTVSLWELIDTTLDVQAAGARHSQFHNIRIARSSMLYFIRKKQFNVPKLARDKIDKN
jgi:hypothetical protein